jgi:hypothetical protein
VAENGKVVDGKVISTCHNSPLDASRGDGVLIGWCQECGEAIVRINPRTNNEEYLDGRSPWTQEDSLRLVER